LKRKGKKRFYGGSQRDIMRKGITARFMITLMMNRPRMSFFKTLLNQAKYERKPFKGLTDIG